MAQVASGNKKATTPAKKSTITSGFNLGGGAKVPTKGKSAGTGSKGSTQGAAVGTAGVPKAKAPAAAPAAAAPAAAATPPPVFSYSPDSTAIENFQTAYAKDQQTIANYAANAANLKSTLQQNTQNNLQQTSQNLYSNDEDMAARGMFQSSIHDGNLADITAASIQNQNNFNVAYNNGLLQLNTNLQAAQQDEGNQAYNLGLDAAQNAENLAIANGGTTTPGSFNASSFINAAPASSVATNPTPTMQNYSNLPSALTTAANQTGTYSGVAVGSTPASATPQAAAAKAPTPAQPATIAGIKTATPSATGAATTPVVPK